MDASQSKYIQFYGKIWSGDLIIDLRIIGQCIELLLLQFKFGLRFQANTLTYKRLQMAATLN